MGSPFRGSLEEDPGFSASYETSRLYGRISDFLDVAVTNTNACGVRVDGSVWCTGDNTLGLLGNGTKVSSHVPVKVTGIADGAKVEIVGSDVWVISSGGAVYGWGYNVDGGLGLGTNTEQIVPAMVIPGGIGGMGHATGMNCAYSAAGGAVSCWTGSANGFYPTPAAVTGLTGVTSMASRCAVTGGVIRCIYSIQPGQNCSCCQNLYTVAPPGITNAAEIGGSDFSLCAREKSDGSVVCWTPEIPLDPCTTPTVVPKDAYKIMDGADRLSGAWAMKGGVLYALHRPETKQAMATLNANACGAK